MAKIDLEKMAKFLVKAKKATYASANKQDIEPERPMHNELEFEEDGFYYRDSYVGFFQAPGMEEVRLGKKGRTIWTMAYSGGMLPKYQENIKFAKQVFIFLKKSLGLVKENFPFRGPKEFEEEGWKYVNEIDGDIKRFKGREKIFFEEKEVFNQDYIGGLVIEK